jgi:hypothetical protein
VPAWLFLLLVAVAVAALVLSARRATTLLVVRFERGVIVRASGRAPGELLADLGDAARFERASGTLRLRLEGGRVELETDVPASTAQRVRNVVGRFSSARLRGAPRLR